MFKKKIFLLFITFILLLSSCVFATDDLFHISATPEPNGNNSNWINSDISSSDEQYKLDNVIFGNVFSANKDFIMTPNNNGGVITGNLFVAALNVKLESDVTYSSEPLGNGSFEIESINASSIIYGNAYIVANTFILEPGAEIDGDLYVAAETVELNQGSTIRGNVYITGTNVTINSSIGQSLYVSASNFNMNSSAFVYRDLHVSSENCSVNGDIHRDAFITSKNLSSGSDFLVTGNLEYSSENELQLSKDIVNGEIKYSKAINSEPKLLDTIFDLITFTVYNFVIALLFEFVCFKSTKSDYKFNIKSVLISFGIGIASILAVLVISLLLFITTLASSLGIVLLLTYILILLVSTPILILLIANKLANKLNLYYSILIVSVIFYLIKLIPVFGTIFGLIFTVTGSGILLKKLFKK